MFPYLALILMILLFSPTSSWSQRVDMKWSGGEHLQLGLEASILACQSLGINPEKCPSQRLFREDRKYTFQYGEVLSSADYYNEPTEFYLDRKSHIVKALKCAYKQTRAHSEQKRNEIDYPNCDSTGLAGLPHYLKVVSHNYNHFGWNNMVAYVGYHTQALQLAKQSYEAKSTNPLLSRQLLNKALIFNGYADHYLTDAFASGHIRVPRIQIKDWADKNLPGTLRSSRGDLLSMFLHNSESMNLHAKKEVGLRVKNARGDVWLTRGDGNLNLFAGEGDLTLFLPKMAVVESFKDILIAAEYGDLPEGVYQATQFVPFQNDMSLIDKLSPEHQKVKRHSDVAWLIFFSTPTFEKMIFFKPDFTRMLDSLSNIFVKFRQDVALEQSENAELKRRLPEKYLQAYLNVE